MKTNDFFRKAHGFPPYAEGSMCFLFFFMLHKISGGYHYALSEAGQLPTEIFTKQYQRNHDVRIAHHFVKKYDEERLEIFKRDYSCPVDILRRREQSRFASSFLTIWDLLLWRNLSARRRFETVWRKRDAPCIKDGFIRLP